jgi:hypothetical protein
VPLLALVAPRTLADTAASLLAMAAQGGRGMPRWPFANLYTFDMVAHRKFGAPPANNPARATQTHPTNSQYPKRRTNPNQTDGLELLADCVLFSGACEGRVALAPAAAAALAAVAAQDASVPGYAAPGGFVPVGEGAASVTLEWAQNDFSAALLAAAAGNVSAAAALTARSRSYANVFNAATPAMLPRFANGSFVDAPSVWAPHPFNPWFTEGNAAQWTWAVPHNVSGLVALFPGGAAQYAAELQVVLANQTAWPFGTFMPNPYAWLGNEPSMLLPWQHAWAGAADAWRVQFWPRWHLRAYYVAGVDCIPGNDDCAWKSPLPRPPPPPPHPLYLNPNFTNTTRRHAVRMGRVGVFGPLPCGGHGRVCARLARVCGRGGGRAARRVALRGRRAAHAACGGAQCERLAGFCVAGAHQWRRAAANAARDAGAAVAQRRRAGARGVFYGGRAA